MKEWIEQAIKRLVDLLAATAGLLLLTPVFLIIAIAIRRDSPGPVFYRGTRLGLGGRPFKILKFRTMYETPESYQGPRVTAQDDPRVTALGRWLRQTKLNELPQLLNVIKGEMSLVGPRPEDPQIAQSWPDEARKEVLSIRPGITSPASVLYRDEEERLKDQPVMETYFEAILPSKLRLDQLYVRNHSFWMDLDVIFWTILVLQPRLEDERVQESAVFAGPFTRLLRRPLTWLLVDATISLVAVSLTGLFWRIIAPLNTGLLRAAGVALVFACLFGVCGMLFGAHRVSWSRADFKDAFNLVAAGGLATLLMLILNILFGGGQPVLPPAMLLLAACLSLAGFLGVRYRGRLLGGTARRWLRLRGGGAIAAQERVLIIGSGETGQFAAWLLMDGHSSGRFTVVGFVDDDLHKLGLRIRGLTVLGQREDIPRLVQQHDVGILVFAIHNIELPDRRRVLEICAGTGAHLVMMPDVLGAFNQAAGTTSEGFLNPAGNSPTSHPVPGDEATGATNAKWELDAMLAELETLVEAGDLSALRQRLGEIRQGRNN